MVLDCLLYKLNGLTIFENRKPIIIRQAINALTVVALHQLQFHLIIKESMNNLKLELSDSTHKLIQKDIKQLENKLIC